MNGSAFEYMKQELGLDDNDENQTIGMIINTRYIKIGSTEIEIRRTTFSFILFFSLQNITLESVIIQI